MEKKDLIQFMREETTQWSLKSDVSIELPFDVLPSEYLSFMEKDIKDNTKHGLINALSNAKRALDCQIESLLYIFCLKNYSDKNRFNIPKKIEILNSIGIIAPRILNKINKVRNTVEHDFYCPSEEEVQDFADVIMLFNSYTDKYLYSFPSDCEIESDEIKDYWIAPSFCRDEQVIVVEVISDKHSKIEMIFKDEDCEFIEFLKLYIKIGYDI
ncbi:MAG TPA: hypothetical protein DC000_10445 [Clostridiales bacterium]|nr:hypothetical protein [Clostridiales bacterium]